MVASNFPHALRLVLVDEGGRDDDPHDHGGRTAFGIIQREYDGYRARHGLSRQDVWKITPAEYTEIYHDRYWMPWCDRLPSGLDYAFFDACVNAGPVQAARCLQKALGVTVDGFMGDVTLSAAQHDTDPEGLIETFSDARRTFYRHLAQFPRYGRGWLARVDHVENAAKAMATVGAENVTRNGFGDILKAQASAKANPNDPVTPIVSPETAASTATGTGILAGVTDQLGTLTSQLSPLQDAVHVVKYILIGVAVLSAFATLYALWHHSKVKAAT